MQLLMILTIFIFAPVALAETGTVRLKVTVPKDTPADAILTLGGNFNSWDPAAEGYRLIEQTDGSYHFTFPPQPVDNILQFKLTRGSWETVEIANDGSNIENRKHTIAPGAELIEIEVSAWADMSTLAAPSTVTGNVLVEDIELPTFPGIRKLRIYLPPDYETSRKRYPVIYMSDAQNLFDKVTAAAGEWGMDELMERLHVAGSPLTSIVVGIDHAGDNRFKEYMPFPFGENRFNQVGDGKANIFADYVANTLKPMVDKRFRTKPGREGATFMGSSMGGLVSLYIGLRHQDRFSKVACLSSALMRDFVGDNMLSYIAEVGRKHPMRIHLDIGDQEGYLMSDTILSDTKAVRNALIKVGFDADSIRCQVIKGGLHSEDSWRLRTEDILKWLNGR